MDLERCVAGCINHWSSGDVSPGFASVVPAGPGDAFSWFILVSGNLASEEKFGDVGGLFEGHKRVFGKDFFQAVVPIKHRL